MPVERTDAILIDAAGRIVDKSVTIVQEEVELTRLELVEKLPALGRDLVRLVFAVVLGVLGLVLLVFALVWLLADYVFGFEHVWASFALLAVLLLGPAAVLGIGALGHARRTGAPVPTAALRQAAELRKVVRS